MLRNTLMVILLSLFTAIAAHGQYSPDYTGGLKVKLNEDGSKYIRFITWHQVWATFSNGPDDNLQADFLLRRTRFLAFAQLNKRFLILTHFGSNTIGANNLGTASPSGANGGNGPFFMHDAWGEFAVAPGKLHIGGGLHYWNGISRLTNQSTLNMLTLDAPIHNWATIGTSDQFARHLGFYAKGRLGKLEYRLAVNDPIDNPTRGIDLSELAVTDAEGNVIEHITDQAAYRRPEGSSNGKVYQGYIKYDIFDKEGNTLPYYVGTYMGKKKILNVGVGFFAHTDGASVYTSPAADATPEAVTPVSFAADVFADLPVGKEMGFTGYASYANHSWGANWTGGVGGMGTGNIFFAQAGLALPEMAKGHRIQPYLHFTNRNIEAFSDYQKSNSTQFGIGANWFIEGHNAKITAEFQSNSGVSETSTTVDPSNILRIQLMVFL